jgi:Zn-dependent protease with chaperone function
MPKLLPFPYKVNICLLAAVFLLTPILYFLNQSLFQKLWIGLIWVLLLVAIVPSGISLIMKDRGRGKPKKLDDPVILEEISSLSTKMGIKRKISIWVIPNWSNAQAICLTLKIGKVLLYGEFGNEQRGIIAHELGHIKGKHFCKTIPIVIVICIVLTCLIFFLRLFSLVPAIVSLSVISLNRLSWRFEYSADLIASESADSNTVETSLKFLANLNQIDVNRDFFLHPSISKRINNLGKPQG